MAWNRHWSNCHKLVTNGATRKADHILDLAKSYRNLLYILVEVPYICDQFLSNNKGISFSNHSAVEFFINMTKPDGIREYPDISSQYASFSSRIYVTNFQYPNNTRNMAINADIIFTKKMHKTFCFDNKTIQLCDKEMRWIRTI